MSKHADCRHSFFKTIILEHTKNIPICAHKCLISFICIHIWHHNERHTTSFYLLQIFKAKSTQRRNYRILLSHLGSVFIFNKVVELYSVFGSGHSSHNLQLLYVLKRVLRKIYFIFKLKYFFK